MVKQRAELTFKKNRELGRHGWVRLTPAYSVKLVEDIIADRKHTSHVLDPFSGTGTTGLTCAQHGIDATLVDINPFLVWLARVKSANFDSEIRSQAKEMAKTIVEEARLIKASGMLWHPPIHNIYRWWSPERLSTLSRIYHALSEARAPGSAKDLLLIAFCRLVIDWSNAAFNHQSMSFRDSGLSMFDESEMIYSAFVENVSRVVDAAAEKIPGRIWIYELDSRSLHSLNHCGIDCVITSPPYSNRMSYIRELRPYMYWLGYLAEAQDAGELDWQAIGGTWGVATSRLSDWEPEHSFKSANLTKTIRSISERSEVLANYVHRYAEDMYQHFLNLRAILVDGAELYYVVGNSKFYDTLASVERWYAEMMAELGLRDVRVRPIRKRNSKKELYEFVVSARYVAS